MVLLVVVEEGAAEAEGAVVPSGHREEEALVQLQVYLPVVELRIRHQ